MVDIEQARRESIPTVGLPLRRPTDGQVSDSNDCMEESRTKRVGEW